MASNLPPGCTNADIEREMDNHDPNTYWVEVMVPDGPHDFQWSETGEFGPYEGALTDAIRSAKGYAVSQVVHLSDRGNRIIDFERDAT